jgi:hypothetical protein
MDIEAIFETKRSGEALHGLEPSLDLKGHAWGAMRMLQAWTKARDQDQAVYTRTGDRRVLPRNTRRLARAYVETTVNSRAFAMPAQERLAKRSYCAALEVELENLAEQILLRLWDPRDDVRKGVLGYIRPLRQLDLLGAEEDARLIDVEAMLPSGSQPTLRESR